LIESHVDAPRIVQLQNEHWSIDMLRLIDCGRRPLQMY